MVGRGMGGVGQGAGLCRMHVFTFASATPSVKRTTVFDEELDVVAAPRLPVRRPADGMSGHLA